MVSLPPRKRLPALCLLLMVVALGAVFVSGMGSLPLASDYYSIEESDTPIHNYHNLSENTQHVISNASGGGTDYIKTRPAEFEQEERNFVRYDGEINCVYTRESGEWYTVTVQNCDSGFEFQNLSERGQWAVSLALDSPDNHVDIRQEPPRELPSGLTDYNGFSSPTLERGFYYIFKNGTAYEFTVGGGSGFGGLFAAIFSLGLFITVGVAATVVGIRSYSKSWVRPTIPFLVAMPVFILYSLVRTLLSDSGRYQWVRWLDQQSPLIAGVLLFLFTSLGVYLYHTYRKSQAENQQE